jgi:transposase-like protein
MVEPGPDFIPPFCPDPKCDFHLNPQGWRFKKDGTHFRKFDHSHIQRYRCPHCRRSFSTQTFSTTYWLKRPDLLELIARALVACSGYRQIARTLDVAPSTIELQVRRLGRHAQLFHELHRPRHAPTEPIVYDGFESFEFSQYWPSHLNTVAGADSQFTYATTVAELRRKGRMTKRQRKRRDELEAFYGRPDPKAIQRATAEVLALVVPPGSPEIVLRTDEHQAYPRALRQLSDRQFRHEQTSSKVPRTPWNSLSPINLLHALMRHSGSNHKRETIAFSRRNQSMVGRDAVHRVWRNYVKSVSEQKRNESPAMRLGLFDHRLSWAEVLERRLFVTQIEPAPPLDVYYWGRVPTRQLPNARDHRLRYAF